MKCLCVLLLMLIVNIQLIGQELIDGTYDFQSDPAKKYTLFIPSSYDSNQAQKLMLALHPLNTNRWDAHSWCDTLSTFAEDNQLMLVCPDGGIDGAVDDAIDTAFTSFLLDEIEVDYNINTEEVYAVGFSWGGKTVYTYGLTHAARFEGFLVIGAAVVPSEVSPIANLAENKKFYIIHGSNDNPSTRFTPIVELLEPSHCVETNYLQGVGHTIDFPNRNDIMTEGLAYLESADCSVISITDETASVNTLLEQTVYRPGDMLNYLDAALNQSVTIRNFMGQIVSRGVSRNFHVPEVPGWYILSHESGHSQKFVVVD